MGLVFFRWIEFIGCVIVGELCVGYMLVLWLFCFVRGIWM